MKKFIMFVLLLTLLAAIPSVILAQNKAWATLSNGVLTFSYGAKPKAPAQVTCLGCGKTLSFSTNYCSNCGNKNKKDFAVYDAFALEDPSGSYAPIWHRKSSDVEKVVFNPSFKQVTNITTTACWFLDMGQLKTIVGIDNLNTSRVKDMRCMFSGCSSIKTINLSRFITNNVTNMSYMFYKCESLTSLDVSKFKTDNVTDMQGMFGACKSLTSLDLSHFKTNKVNNMSLMFSKCHSLKSLNLSSFDTSNVSDFGLMFESCYGMTTLDISNFDTRKPSSGDFDRAYSEYMFAESSLKTIYVSKLYWVPYPKTRRSPGTLGDCNATIIKK